MTLLVSGGLVSATSAQAVTVGQVVDGPLDVTCLGNLDVQTAVADGTPYRIPAPGYVNAFSTRASAFVAGTKARLVVFRPDVVVRGVSNTFITLNGTLKTAAMAPLAVQAGDLLGILLQDNSGSACAAVTTPGDTSAGAFFDGLPTPGQIIVLTANYAERFSIAANLVADGCDLPRTPVGCWGFNEAPGATTAFDVSGAANHGLYANNPTLGLPGVRATAMRVDGTNDVVRVPDAASLDVTTAFTAETWVRRSSTAQSVDLMNKGAGGMQLVVLGGAAGNQVFLRKAGVTTIAHSLHGVPADGAFHQVAATMNGAGSAKIYIDGVLDSVLDSATQVLAPTTFPLTLGAPSGSQATLDEFALYRQALSATELRAHYLAGHNPPAT